MTYEDVADAIHKAFEGQRANNELFLKKQEELEAKHNKTEESVKILEEKAGRLPGRSSSIESLGQLFVKSAEFQAWRSAPALRGRCTSTLDTSLFAKKAALTTSATLAPATERIAGIVPAPMLMPAALGLFSTRAVGSSHVEYLRSTGIPSPGARTQFPEGSAKQEQTIGTEIIGTDIQTIAAWTSASTQILADIAGLAAFIDGQLQYSVAEEICRQCLFGAPGTTAGELQGLTGVATAYDTTRNQTGDGPAEALSHAAEQLAEIGVQANAAVLSPQDAEGLRLTKTTTGEYLLAMPSNGTGVTSLWGLSLTVDHHMPAAHFLVGDFSARQVELLDRMQTTVDISYEHADFFTKNLAAIRAEWRGALGIYQPAAFVYGTAYPTPSLTRSEGNGGTAAEHMAAKQKRGV
jgi:HK97 family phage major capsid protein